MNRYAKIVATIGPASGTENAIRDLISSGMDVARINFSHGTHLEHTARIQLIRKISKAMDHPVAILQDLQGPKIRVRDLPGGKIILKSDQTIQLTGALDYLERDGDTVVPVDLPGLERLAHPGQRILMDDGNLEVEVTERTHHALKARVILGGELRSNKGVNLPGVDLPVDGFTKKDEEDLAFGIQIGVDAVAVSFVRRAEDLLRVRKAMTELETDPKNIFLIAKLERPEALNNLQTILDAADGVMVARGDLGVEMAPATVPVAQKTIISAANQRGIFVITATQMLESMIHNPRPTRAETSDVANAIFDGSDAVMLSGETAVGAYPIESVTMMSEIIYQAESNFEKWGICAPPQRTAFHDDAISMTLAARELAHDLNVAAVAVFTQTGRTALLMSKARPRVPILGFTPNTRTFQRLNMFWGVKPFLVPFVSTTEEMLASIDRTIQSETDIQPGQQVVVISGFPIPSFHKSNFALLHTVGE